MPANYDAIIIGTGQSGPALAGRLNKEGKKTAVIERKLVGGTCVNVGCTPTKTLVGSARIAYLAQQASEFGILINGDIAVDMQRVKARKDEISGASNQGVLTPVIHVSEACAAFLIEKVSPDPLVEIAPAPVRYACNLGTGANRLCVLSH